MAKFTILSKRERPWSKFVHALSYQSSYGDKIRYGTEGSYAFPVVQEFRWKLLQVRNR